MHLLLLLQLLDRLRPVLLLLLLPQVLRMCLYLRQLWQLLL